jgi:hypothetical protein
MDGSKLLSAFEILASVRREVLHLGIQRPHRCGVTPLAQFDRGCPLVKFGEQGGFHLILTVG